MINSITNRQMFFFIFLTITTNSPNELPKTIIQSAGKSSWIVILIMSLIYAIVAAIITKLHNCYPGKTLLDYSRELTSRFLGTVIVIYYILVALMIGVYLNVKLAALVTTNFLPHTPPFAVILLAILLFGYVANKGIVNIARLYEILGVLLLAVVILMCALMINQGMSVNARPLFRMSNLKDFKTAIKDLIIPFTGLGVLLVVPFADHNRKASKTAFFTMIFIGLFYVLIVESTLIILGLSNTITFNYSFLEAIKMVRFPVIERTDILYMTFGLAGLFAGTISIYISAVEFACRLFPSIKRVIITIAIGALLFILSLFGLRIHNITDLYGGYAPYFLICTSILIPSSLFILSKVKKRQSQPAR